LTNITYSIALIGSDLRQLTQVSIFVSPFGRATFVSPLLVASLAHTTDTAQPAPAVIVPASEKMNTRSAKPNPRLSA
jgi:hypothetical protein